MAVLAYDDGRQLARTLREECYVCGDARGRDLLVCYPCARRYPSRTTIERPSPQCECGYKLPGGMACPQCKPTPAPIGRGCQEYIRTGLGSFRCGKEHGHSGYHLTSGPYGALDWPNTAEAER